MRRADVARIALVALLACAGFTLSAGASSAFATYGTIKVHKVNVGGDLSQKFSFDGYWRAAGASGLSTKSFSVYGFAPGKAPATGPTGNTYAASVYYNTYSGAPEYKVTEAADPGYELTGIDCDVPYGSKATKYLADRYVAIRVGVDKTVDCTFTNTVKKATIKVVKKVVSSVDDAGRFDLYVDHTKVAGPVGDQGYGSLTVSAGKHSVSELAAAGTGTDLADYVSSTSCTKDLAYVAPGDSIVCTITNTRKATIDVQKHTNADDAATLFGFTLKQGLTQVGFSLHKDGEQSTTVDPGKEVTVSEDDPRPVGYELADLACKSGATPVGVADQSTRTATVTPKPGEAITCQFTNNRLEPAIDIKKSGPAEAYSGDTLEFSFAVSNPGRLPLKNVVVTDDHCPNVVGPVSGDTNADSVLDLDETWTFTCSMVAVNVLNQDANPVMNTATVNAVDEFENPVTDQAQHTTLFLHPAIDIKKSGPATAVAGSTLAYTLDVGNTGDQPLTDVAVTDPRCSSAPALQSVNGDLTAATLDPGDRWTYTCSATTAVGDTSAVNVADVKGSDKNGKVVTDEDTVTTTLSRPATTPPTTPTAQAGSAPAQQVAGVTQTSRPQRGTASLRGPSACPRTRAFSATVTGRQIRRVTFFVGSKRIRTVTKADRNGRWTVSLRTSSLRPGANGVRARVEFKAASQTRTRTLRITVTPCAARSVRPQFTG